MRHKLHIDTFMADSFFFSLSLYFALFLFLCIYFNGSLTFGGLSQLFPAPFPVFVFCYPLPPLLYGCFVFLFLALDFYGDTVFHRNNGGRGIRRRKGRRMAFS